MVQKDCTDAEKAAEVTKCAADVKAFQAAYDAIKANQFDPLSKASFQHQLDVSAYETALQDYNGKLAQFAADVAAYAATLTGTYMTTALNTEADRLDQERAVLLSAKTLLNGRYDDLFKETNDDKAKVDTLKADLDKLSKDILDDIKRFRCVPCKSLVPLRARVDALRARSNFVFNPPSGPPGDPAPVPRLPQQPQPPQPGSPGPRAPQRPPTTKVYLSSGGPQLNQITAGDVWPYVIPPEGCPRVCVRVVYDWSPKTPTIGFRQGTGGFTFTHIFDHGIPAVVLGKGLTATDIVVSDDQEQIFFTVSAPSSGLATGTLSSVTIKDGPLTIDLASSDPKTSLRVDEDGSAGLASLTMATLIAIDGAFAVLPAAAPSVSGFLAALQKPHDSLDEMYKAFADRVRQSGSFPAAKFGDNLDMSAVAGPHGTPDPDLGAYWPYDPSTWSAAPLPGDLPYWFAAEINYGIANSGAPVPTDAEAQQILDLLWALATMGDRLLPGGPSVP